MPITFNIDVSKGLIVTRCFGRVTLAEVQEHFQELARAWPPVVDRLDVLLDLLDQTSLPGLQDLEHVATAIDGQIGPQRFGRCAVITEQDSLFGSMQMFEVLVGRLFDSVQVFRTPSEAVVWLVPPRPRPGRRLSTQ